MARHGPPKHQAGAPLPKREHGDSPVSQFRATDVLVSWFPGFLGRGKGKRGHRFSAAVARSRTGCRATHAVLSGDTCPRLAPSPKGTWGVRCRSGRTWPSSSVASLETIERASAAGLPGNLEECFLSCPYEIPWCRPAWQRPPQRIVHRQAAPGLGLPGACWGLGLGLGWFLVGAGRASPAGKLQPVPAVIGRQQTAAGEPSAGTVIRTVCLQNTPTAIRCRARWGPLGACLAQGASGPRVHRPAQCARAVRNKSATARQRRTTLGAPRASKGCPGAPRALPAARPGPAVLVGFAFPS
jgi:hypothetical protein